MIQHMRKAENRHNVTTLDQGVYCFSEAVACNQAVLGKLETFVFSASSPPKSLTPENL
jgi:hypothetical protein